MTHSPIKTLLALSALALASHASAQITLYEGEGFRGRAFTTSEAVPNFARNGMNDRSSSVVIDRGRWEVCEDARFGGRCAVLRQGSYDSLERLGLENKISSVRPADRRRQYDREESAQMETPNYAWRRRANERVYEAPVTSVRAVMGTNASQHCWVERQQVSDNRGSSTNVGGAVVGALIGGVLGHQVGGGSGKDIATAGGAVTGAVIGANMGNSGSSGIATRDVRRCNEAVQGTPAYWDVGYNFRGQPHQIQMSTAPGATIAVNGNGEPRQ
jgi:uncharacterized protein YcfJ